MSDTSDRTIPATPRRREAARREGLAAPAALPAWAAAAAVAILLAPGWFRGTIPAAAEVVRTAILAAGDGGRGEQPWPVTIGLVWPTLWLVAASAAAGLVVRFACDGLSWRPERVAFDLRRIDPVKGLARIFSRDTLLAIVGAAAALLVLGGVAAWSARALVALQQTDINADAAAVGGVAWRAAGWLAGGALIVAAAQWILARRRFEQRIRMTPQELADEAKDMQSDPRVRLLQQQRRRPQPARVSSTSGTA